MTQNEIFNELAPHANDCLITPENQGCCNVVLHEVEIEHLPGSLAQGLKLTHRKMVARYVPQANTTKQELDQIFAHAKSRPSVEFFLD